MDEISVRANGDPVAFRLQHLRETRIIDVLKSAAEAAEWDARPSPKLNIAKTGVVSGRGIACVAYEGNNGYTAMIAEVNVDLESGRVQPTRFVVALDCGPISNPDGVRNQIEGGVLQGMSRALVEEVTWDERRVTSTDWETYSTLYVGSEMPKIDIVLMNPTGVPATGAGETAITAVPAAIGNAVFDATGVRLREVPFTAARFKAARLAQGT
jgi:CO/xanthine dehydrogenase Mo-binding subunit